MAAVKALACEPPALHGVPLARWSVRELVRAAERQGLVASVGATTVWRWLDADALRPWAHRPWIFPRDPQFAPKASRVLGLYEGRWEGEELGDDDFVLCSDEKPGIQARRRLHPTLGPGPGRAARVEHEYAREGALVYFAAWDVRRAKVFGRCEPKGGIAPFERLLAQVLARRPYRTARRVFVVTDNGSSHRGARYAERLRARWPNAVPVHTPVHASWLNQVEIYLSVVQRKVLTPNDFASTAEVAERLAAFERHYQKAARSFRWEFTRHDLRDLLARLTLAEEEASDA